MKLDQPPSFISCLCHQDANEPPSRRQFHMHSNKSHWEGALPWEWHCATLSQANTTTQRNRELSKSYIHPMVHANPDRLQILENSTMLELPSLPTITVT